MDIGKSAEDLAQATERLRSSSHEVHEQLRELRQDHELRLKEMQKRMEDQMFKITTTKVSLHEFIDGPGKVDAPDPMQMKAQLKELQRLMEEEQKKSAELEEASAFMKGLEEIK